MGVVLNSWRLMFWMFNNLIISVNSFRYQQLDNYQRRSLAPVR
jgi:hypothetical protein